MEGDSYLFLNHSSVEQRSGHFSVKRQIVNSLGFEGHMVSITTTEPCHTIKEALDNTQTSECACFLVKNYL